MGKQLHYRKASCAKAASRVGTGGRDCVIRERLTGEWADRLLRVLDRARRAEIALSFQIGRHRRQPRHAAHFAPPLLRPEKEYLILFDRPAEGIAKIVRAQLSLRFVGLIQEK